MNLNDFIMNNEVPIRRGYGYICQRAGMGLLNYYPIAATVAIVVLGPPVVAVVIFEVILNATAIFNHGKSSDQVMVF